MGSSESEGQALSIPYEAFEKAAAAAPVTPVEVPVAPAATGVPCDPARILVVDDEMRIREVFRLILSDGLPDCKIDVASNGAEALDVFGKFHHAVCVMDLHMSVMDGQAAFFKVEKFCLEKGWEMPAVVFCTGFAHPEAVRSVVVRNSTHCLLSKPVRGETLLNIVRTRLAGRGQAKA